MDHHVRIATAADAESAARLLVDFNREFGSPAPEAAQIAPHLAALLESQGDSAGARRLQARAARSERADSESKR